MEDCGAVGIFFLSANNPFILITDFAAFANRIVPVSIYATSSEQQVEYIVRDAEAEFIFVGDQSQYDIARKDAAHFADCVLYLLGVGVYVDAYSAVECEICPCLLPGNVSHACSKCNTVSSTNAYSTKCNASWVLNRLTGFIRLIFSCMAA